MRRRPRVAPIPADRWPTLYVRSSPLGFRRLHMSDVSNVSIGFSINCALYVLAAVVALVLTVSIICLPVFDRR